MDCGDFEQPTNNLNESKWNLRELLRKALGLKDAEEDADMDMDQQDFECGAQAQGEGPLAGGGRTMDGH